MAGGAYPLCVDRCSTRDQQQPTINPPAQSPPLYTGYTDIGKNVAETQRLQLENEIAQEKLNLMKRDRIQQYQQAPPQQNESYKEAPAKPDGKLVLACSAVGTNGVSISPILNIDYDSGTVNGERADITDDAISSNPNGELFFTVSRRDGSYTLYRKAGIFRPVTVLAQGQCRKAPGRQF